ncbi:SpoIID/LytB domain-containing protein [Bacillus luteolus]|uniref:SpoIID/LytB domain-containing protein n=2 Tax=Litchfieldia luteola TaxID=682179 RepID=A0ABR9QMP1_9BACI|nr:SpoIID/LytB domain-containing protein [Cytobacillus luteolus]MBE4909772.1 SpoIID/LytB domain-containing protein [Cytobacillus luteolus]
MRYLLIPIMTVMLLFLLPHDSNADEMVSVKLRNYIKDTSEITFKISGEYFSLDPTIMLKEGVKYKLSVKDGKITVKGDGQTQELGSSFALLPDTYNVHHFIHINDRPYLGAMEFLVEEGNIIRPVNQLPLEDYLKGVVPHEVYPSWEIETLKSQALAARTYAASHLGKVIDDTISYQVYAGYSWDDRTTVAVVETKGEVLTHNNRLIEAFYSASNGGMTENNSHVWGGDYINYYPIKKDPYDPVNPWEFTLNQTQIDLAAIDFENKDWWDKSKEKDEEITNTMKGWLKKNGYPGDLKILSIPTFSLSEQKNQSTRAEKGSLQIEFLHRLFDGTIMIERADLQDQEIKNIRRLIGGSIFKSFLIDSLALEDGVYTMKGKGYGHGVGMSQWGASVMGEQGKSYKEILQFYFPGTEITNMPQSESKK